MADTSNLTQFLTDVANAIKDKKGTTDKIPAADFDTEIKAIETGVDTSDATATINDLIAPKTAYVNGKKITGHILPEYREPDGYEFSYDNVHYKLEIPLENYAKFVVFKGNDGNFWLSVTDNIAAVTTELTSKYSDTINLMYKDVDGATVGTEYRYYGSDCKNWTLRDSGTDGYIRTSIKDMIVSNIDVYKDGKLYFKESERTQILKSLTTGGIKYIDTSDADATASDIAHYKTAYVNGKKITGSLADYPKNNSISGGIVTDEADIKNITIWNKNSDTDLLFDKILRGGAGLRASYSNVADAIGLTADKILKGNNILGVEGTAETGGTTTDGVKLFETEEAMQADTTAKEGDLAVVYRSEIRNMTVDTEVTAITFPETVTLPTAFTGNTNCRLRAVDSSVMFDGNCDLSKTSFRFNGYSDTGMIRVQYTSEDGITYTRTRFQGDSGDLTNPVEVPTCKVERVEEWNDNIGYFLQVGGHTFEGLYENKIDTNIIQFLNLSATSFSNIDLVNKNATVELNSNDKHPLKIDKSKLVALLKANDIFVSSCALFVTNNNELMYTHVLSPLYDTSGNLLGYCLNGNYTNASSEFYKINLDNSTVTKVYTKSASNHFYGSSSSDNYYYLPKDEIDCVTLPVYINDNSNTNPSFDVEIASTDSNNPLLIYVFQLNYDYQGTAIKYFSAPTQLTLENANELLPGKIAYGKNEVIEGDGSIWDNVPISTILENYYGLSLVNNNVYGDAKYAQSYNVTNKNPGKMIYLKESSDGDISINRLTKEAYPVFYNSSYTRKLVIKSSTNADYMDIDGKNVFYSITTGMYLGRDDTMEVINDKFYYTTLADNVCKINCLDLNTGVNTEITDFSDTSYTWSDTWVTMLGCKNYIAINSFWRSSNRHLNRLGKIDLSTNTYTQIYNHSGTGTSTGGYLWLTKSNIYLSTYTTNNVHSLYKLNLSTGAVTTCFTNKNINWSMSGSAGYNYGMDDDNYLFLTQSTSYAINLSTGAVSSYTVESKDTSNVSGVTVVLSNGTDIKCIQETINGVKVLSLYEYTYSISGTKVTITRGNLLFRYNISNMDRANETEDYKLVNLYSGISPSLAWLHFAFVGLSGFDICCDSSKTHLLGWKRYSISTINDYDVVVLDTSLNDSAPYNIVFKSDTGFESNSGPITQEEYDLALSTSNEILTGTAQDM